MLNNEVKKELINSIKEAEGLGMEYIKYSLANKHKIASTFKDEINKIKLEISKKIDLSDVESSKDLIQSLPKNSKIVALGKIACSGVMNFEKVTDALNLLSGITSKEALPKEIEVLKNDICPTLLAVANDYDAKVEQIAGAISFVSPFISNPLDLFNTEELGGALVHFEL
jgi:hypothetical protein